MPSAKKTGSTESASKQLAAFIAKYDPAVAALARTCRATMRKILPTANELVYDNYQFLAVGYSSTDRASDSLLSLAVSPKGVALCMHYGAHLPDPTTIMYGGGNQIRFVHLDGAKSLTAPAVRALIRAADAHGRVPLPRTGNGQLIIKAISAKQRPRRPVKK
ncbi:MAG: DUF1801 domain-containing protein [Gemmatimonadota bacterium]|nr:DUF1801 domain-containing protein [Gemmatimonadota bacterium]